ncbi:D-aminoacyl-tRNA deacylase [Luteolibacter algae]|uniref:D-aminoacyl-tRNA deacylase n=1 Tax=Luteolibacter algae TaxID=454151 RepID=A0ABW5DC27_9BACT
MRALLQRVSSASVTIDGRTVSEIACGLLVLIGIESGDDCSDIEWLCNKIARMRIFEDEQGKMNASIADVSGEILVVSQFTLHASTRKGNRPSFLKAAPPQISEPLYESFCEKLSAEIGKPVGRGVFGADMKVALINDGPVTIWIDSRNRE